MLTPCCLGENRAASKTVYNYYNILIIIIILIRFSMLLLLCFTLLFLNNEAFQCFFDDYGNITVSLIVTRKILCSKTI